MPVRITIPIEPVGQLRPRATRYGKSIRLYDPPRVATFKKSVADYVDMVMSCEGISKFENTALEVRISVFRQVQKNLSKKERDRRLSHVHRPTVKFDLDNYIKSILDALNGKLWDDDKNIVSIVANKYYAAEPYFEVEVNSLD